MSKEDAVALLIEKGFNAQLIDGVVDVVSDDRKDFDRIKRILKKAGYSGSYGWKKNLPA